jgi:hypothetical protein
MRAMRSQYRASYRYFQRGAFLGLPDTQAQVDNFISEVAPLLAMQGAPLGTEDIAYRHIFAHALVSWMLLLKAA